MTHDSRPRVRWHYYVLPVLVMAVFIPVIVQWFMESSFEGPGDYVNALFAIMVAVVLPVVFLIAIRKGKLQPDYEHFLQHGYVENRTLSRSKPGLLPTALGLFMMLIIGSVVVGSLVGYFQSRDSLGSGEAWALLLLFPFYLYLYIFIYLIARFVLNRRIARLMAGEGFTVPEPSPEALEQPVDLPGRCEIITEQQRTPLRGRPTADHNALGDPPLRLLYLWNFDVGYPTMEMRSWQRLGPVYWLWGPGNVPASQVLSLAFRRQPEAHFASTDADVEAWLHGNNELPRRNWWGRLRYPALKIACLAQVWQQAVARACDHVDRVIVDARGYTRERSGLRWELQHVVRNLPPERFLILADATTDLRAIVNAVHAVGDPSSDRLARIVYPPLLQSPEALKKLFRQAELPALSYWAPDLVSLLR